LSTLVLVLAAAATACGGGQNGQRSTLQPTTRTFVALADTYVRANEPGTSFGKNGELRVDDTPVARSYIRFDIFRVPGTIVRATLRLYTLTSSGDGFQVRASGDSWIESQVRNQIEEVDARLLPSPIYGQVPAFAATDRGVLDLLAVDRHGRLTVLELKASEDIHLPLQALDYWMRVKWHLDRGEFSGRGYFPGIEIAKRAPRLLLVAPALDFHPTNETILRFFAQQVNVERLGVGIEWRKDLRVMFRVHSATCPSPSFAKSEKQFPI